MNRRQIKYLCARMRTEADGGAKRPEDMPEGFEESFEKQKNFRGWASYSVTWTVDADDPWKIVLLDKSLEEEWNELLLEKVPVLPGYEDESD